MAYELDGFALTITIPTGGPETYGFASCVAESIYGSASVGGVATIGAENIICTFAADELTAGDWWVQVRAGENEASAQTIYTEKHRVRKSLRVS